MIDGTYESDSELLDSLLETVADNGHPLQLYIMGAAAQLNRLEFAALIENDVLRLALIFAASYASEVMRDNDDFREKVRLFMHRTHSCPHTDDLQRMYYAAGLPIPPNVAPHLN